MVEGELRRPNLGSYERGGVLFGWRKVLALVVEVRQAGSREVRVGLRSLMVEIGVLVLAHQSELAQTMRLTLRESNGLLRDVEVACARKPVELSVLHHTIQSEAGQGRMLLSSLQRPGCKRVTSKGLTLVLIVSSLALTHHHVLSGLPANILSMVPALHEATADCASKVGVLVALASLSAPEVFSAAFSSAPTASILAPTVAT